MTAVQQAHAGFQLSEEQLAVRELCRDVAARYVAPRAAEIDATAEFPQDVRQAMAEHDILGLPFSEEHGGTGTGALALIIGIEEISKVCASSGLILAVQELGSLPIKLAGTDEQKQQWLPKLASGEHLAAYGLTEPEAGSDSASRTACWPKSASTSCRAPTDWPRAASCQPAAATCRMQGAGGGVHRAIPGRRNPGRSWFRVRSCLQEPSSTGLRGTAV